MSKFATSGLRLKSAYAAAGADEAGALSTGTVAPAWPLEYYAKNPERLKLAPRFRLQQFVEAAALRLGFEEARRARETCAAGSRMELRALLVALLRQLQGGGK